MIGRRLGFFVIAGSAACSLTTSLDGLSSGGTAPGKTDGGALTDGGSSDGATAGDSTTVADTGLPEPPPGCVDKSVTKAGGVATAAPGGLAFWVSLPGACVAKDGEAASITLQNFLSSPLVSVKKFGFAIPAKAFVRGVEVVIRRLGADDAALRDTEVRLVVDGVAQGADKHVATFWPDVYTDATYGGSTDRWGLLLTPAFVNDEGFGAAFGVKYDKTGAGSAEVDGTTITVTYCE